MTIGSSAVVDEDDCAVADSEPSDVLRSTRVGAGRTRRVSNVSLVIALVPIVVAAARAIDSGWIPVGDDAVIAVRSHDVLGNGPLPWVGTWSGKSWSVGFHMHHPGPLFFDVLAVPAALIPGPAGLVVGAAVINGAAVVGTFLLARRRGGEVLAVTAMAVTAALAWSMGSAVLAEPWNVSALLLPFFCFCLLAWSLACRDLVCLPSAVFLGSLLAQANLAFLPLVLGMSLFAGAAAIVDQRARSDDPQPTESIWPSRMRRLGVLSLVVLGASWIRPVAEQLFGEGYGNMTRLARSSIEPAPTLSAGNGARAVASIVTLPPWWGRPAYSEAFTFTAFGNPLPSLSAALVSLAGLAGLLVWGVRSARRRQDRTVVTLLAAAAALVGVALVTAKFTPTSGYFGTTAYQLRWLWPVGAFVVFALVAAVVRWFTRFAPDGNRVGWATGVGVAVTGLFVVLNLPSSDLGTTAPTATLPVARDLVHDVAAADLDGPLLVECAESVFDPYCEAVFAELQRRGVAFVMRDPVAVHQVGSTRAWNGSNAVARLVVAVGDRAMAATPGARVISRHLSLSEDELLELFYLQEGFKQQARDGQLRLSERGQIVAARGDLPSVTVGSGAPQFDPDLLLALRTRVLGDYRRDLYAMAREGLLDLDDDWAENLARYADLQVRWDGQTAAVFLEPLPGRTDVT